MSNKLNPSGASNSGTAQGQVLYSMNQAQANMPGGVPSQGIKQGPQGQQQNTASQAQASALINQAAVKQQYQQQQYQQRMAQQNRGVPQGNTGANQGLYTQQFSNFKIPNPAGSSGMQGAAGHQMSINFVGNNAPVFHPAGMNGLGPYESNLNRQQAMMQQQNSSVQSSSSQQDSGPTSMGAGNQASQNFHPAHSLNMGVSSGMMPGANQFNKFGGANEMGAQGQMFKNMMLGGGAPQGPINQMGSDSTSFAPNQFSGGALGTSQIGNSTGQVGASSLAGNTNANNMQQNDMQTNFQMNMQMSSGGMGSLGQGSVDMEPRNVQGLSGGGAMRTNASSTEVQQSMKRKANSRPGSNPLYVSDINEPKKFDVLDMYEQASNGPSYRSLEYSLFNGGIDTGIDIGELSVFNSSLLHQEVLDSVSGEKRSGFAAHSSLTSQNVQYDIQKFSDRFLGPFCQSQLNQRKITEHFQEFNQEFLSQAASGSSTQISGTTGEPSSAEAQQVSLMRKYFNLTNTSMHLQINPPQDFAPNDPQNEQDRLNYIAESESFNHEFLLPKSYDMPSMREKPAGPTSQSSGSPVTPERCKQLPDTVLFYIFYSMPFDRAQLNASHELKRRSWFYAEQSMRWMKAVEQPTNASPQHPQGKAGAGKKGRNTSKNQVRNRNSLGGGTGGNGSSAQRQIVVFNPQIWKEETLSVIED